MKWMSMVIILLGPKVPSKKTVEADRQVGPTKQNDSNTNPSSLETKKESKTADVPCHCYKNDQEAHQWWTDAQWVGVIVSGGTMLITFGTLVGLWSQINAVRRTERAVFVPVCEQEVWINPESTNGELGHSFRWNFKNEGKTAGFLRGTYAQMLLLQSLDELPERPDYPKKHIRAYQGDPLVSGGAMDRNFYVTLEDPRDFQTIKEEYRNGGKFLFVFAVARYDDMFGKSHETRFAVRYSPHSYSVVTGEFVIAGPKAYNEYT